MIKDYKIEKIKQEIEAKREELNRIIQESLDRDKILSFSKELDVLISEYYSVCQE